jgi:hypothetical protein
MSFAFGFFLAKTPFDPLPNFVVDLINTPLLTTSMVGAITVSAHVVVIPTSNDWVIINPTSCLWVLTTIAFETIGEAVLIQIRQCSILWLPIGILCRAECGCEYTFNFLLMV